MSESPPARRIDVHAHFPNNLSGATAVTADRGLPAAQLNPNPAAAWNSAAAVNALDSHGIDVQILSLPHLYVSPDGQPGQAAHCARAVNETFARIVSEHPDRFGAFATIPADTSDDALSEMTYALDELGLDGIAVTSNTGGRYLSDPFFQPVLAKAERRGVPIFLHPAAHLFTASLTLGRPPFLLENPFDTARSITDAIYAGVWKRHPELRLIAAHCGGALPAVAWRISHLAPIGRAPSDGDVTAADVDDAVSRIYFDTALTGHPSTLHALLTFTDTRHLLYGTDSGAATDHIIQDNTTGLANLDLPDPDIDSILHGNAERLIPRLGSTASPQSAVSFAKPPCPRSEGPTRPVP